MTDYSDTQLAGTEIKDMLSLEIEKRANNIRALKAEIEHIRIEEGLIEKEEAIEFTRSELLSLIMQYRDLTGTNWSDDEGYVRYVSPGESHRYETKRVDEGLAASFGLLGEITSQLDDRTDPDIKAVLTGSLPDAESIGAADLFEMMREIQAERDRIVQETLIRLNALDVKLKAVAGARSTTHIPEKVAIK